MIDPKMKIRTCTIAAVMTIATLLPFLNCGPKPPGKAAKLNTPYNLKATAGSKSVELHWQIDRDPKTPISGYNIYLAETQNSDGVLFNSSPYPGNTDGDASKESIEIPRLENGRRYYAYVRTLLSDGSLSKPSGRVSFLPLAQGEITISQNHTADRSGYSFTEEKYTQARDFANDLYIFATNDKSGISSPSKLHTSLRKTEISLNDSPFDTSQPLKKGQGYTLKTANGGSARLTLIGIEGSAPNIKATFKYIYYPPGTEPR